MEKYSDYEFFEGELKFYKKRFEAGYKMIGMVHVLKRTSDGKEYSDDNIEFQWLGYVMGRRDSYVERTREKPVAWFKHGPYDDGEKLECVFDDPQDEIQFSALLHQDQYL